MSSKEIVRDLLEKLPDEASLTEIAQEIELVAGIREGLDELDRGEGMRPAALRARLHAWTRMR